MRENPLGKEQVFELLMDIKDPIERARLLSEYCGSDAEIRAEVEELLAIDDKLGSFDGVQTTTRDMVALRNPLRSSRSGQEMVPPQIPGYELGELIGRGGQGGVYIAKQLRSQ